MKSITREQLVERLDAHREDILRDMAALIAIESRTGVKEETDKALRFVIERARDMGMRTGYTRGMDAGYAEIGDGTETVGVLAHVDVVDVGDIANWPNDPFKLVMDEAGLLHGRGVLDDKGPVIISLYTLRVLMELDIPLKRRIRLIVGTSEEAEWTDMKNYFAEFGEPDFGFSPDGDFPIFNIEKGYCDIHMLFSEDKLDELEEVTAGESPNSVPSRAVLKLKGEDEEVFRGVAVHSSAPQNGDNAILHLAEAAMKKGFKFGEFLYKMFPDEFASPLRLDDGTDTIDGIYVSRTISCPTVIRLTEDGVMVNINIRSRYGVDRTWLDEAFGKFEKEYGYTFAFHEFTGAMMVDPRLPFMQKMNEVFTSFGYEGGFEVAGGASYAATMHNCVSFGPLFPGMPDSCHKEDESFPFETLMTSAAIYAEYLAVCAESDNWD